MKNEDGLFSFFVLPFSFFFFPFSFFLFPFSPYTFTRLVKIAITSLGRPVEMGWLQSLGSA